MKSMKIFFDIDSAVQPNKSGVGYYSLELLKALSESDNIEITAHYFNFLGKQKIDLPSLSNVTYKPSRLIHRKVFNLLRRLYIEPPIELLTWKKYDFSIFPNFLSKKSLFKTRSCVAVHDFAFLKFKETVSRRNQKDLEKFVPRSLKSSAFAVCISETMARELKKHYPWFEKDILVTKIPPTEIAKVSEANVAVILKNLGLEIGYFMFIGNQEPRKNLDNLLVGFSKTSEDFRQKNKLVLVGSKGWNNGLDERLLSKISKDVIATGYVNEEQKSVLLANARALVMPSLYEGYGMPIIEAMSVDTPVLASDIEIFREITKNNCVFFDPYSVESIAKTFQDFEEDKATTNSALRYVKSLSWEDVASRLLDSIASAYSR